MSPDQDLERLVAAQEQIYPRALDEIRRGRKRSHWMWYIFPQLRGLGRSAQAERYGIQNAEEARAYLAHPILGARYVECVEALQDLIGHDPVAVFGEVDALKLRSSLTLFEAIGDQPLFAAALTRWFGGDRDPKTLAKLGANARAR